MIKGNKCNAFKAMMLYGMWCFLEGYMYYVYLDNEVNKMDIEYESLIDLLTVENCGPLKMLIEQFKLYLNDWIDLINNEITKILSENFFSNEDMIINFNDFNTIEVIYNKECYHFH